MRRHWDMVLGMVGEWGREIKREVYDLTAPFCDVLILVKCARQEGYAPIVYDGSFAT